MLGENEGTGRLKYTVAKGRQYPIHILNPATFEAPPEASAVVKCRCDEHVEVRMGIVSKCPNCGQDFGIDVEFKVWYEHTYDPFATGE